VLVVQELGGQDGVAFTLPLVLFLFVVALGTDYTALVVSSVLVPAVTAPAGRRTWWPGPVARAPRPVTAPEQEERVLELV
jgi:uncharacterized membrane protein YdfJ with MMPL/SSD domain